MRELSSLKGIKQDRELCRNISKIASDVKAEILEGARNSRVRQVESDPRTSPRHSIKCSGCNNENIGVSVEVQLGHKRFAKLHGETEEGFLESQSTGGLSDIVEHDDGVDDETYYAHHFKSVLRSHLESFFASDVPQNLSPCQTPQANGDGVLNQTNSADDDSFDAIRNNIFELLSVH